MIRIIKTSLLTICLIILFAGCTNSEYENALKEYKGTFIRASEFLVNTNERDSLKAIRNMDVTLLDKEIKSLQKSIDKMKSTAESKDEKRFCENREKEIERLKFLLYANKNIENISLDERTKVYSASVFTKITRKEFLEEMEK